MDTITRVSQCVADELTEHFDWGDDLREAGFHRQATCYELFLDGRIPYDVMVRHFERQRLAGFADKLKSLPGKLKSIVQQQTAKWQQGIADAVKGSATELAALQDIGDEDAAKTKKTLIQRSVEAVAKRVMSDYEESLAAIKDDPAAVEEFVDKLAQGAVKTMATTVGGAAAAFLFAGPAAVGVFLFRKALFNAAKSAIKAGDAKLERALGEGYTKKKQQVKDVAKEKITSILRRVFKSAGKVGEGIGLGVGAMAIFLKLGMDTKEALGHANGYLERRIGKAGAAAVTGVLKGLIIGGVVRGGASLVGAVADWFSDAEVAGAVAGVAAVGAVEDAAEDAADVAGGGAQEAAAAGAELEQKITETAVKVKVDDIFVSYMHQVGEQSGAAVEMLTSHMTFEADNEQDAVDKAMKILKRVAEEQGQEIDWDLFAIDKVEGVQGGDGDWFQGEFDEDAVDEEGYKGKFVGDWSHLTKSVEESEGLPGHYTVFLKVFSREGGENEFIELADGTKMLEGVNMSGFEVLEKEMTTTTGGGAAEAAESAAESDTGGPPEGAEETASCGECGDEYHAMLVPGSAGLLCPDCYYGERDDLWAKLERRHRAIARLGKDRAMELGVTERQYEEAVENIGELDEGRAEGVPEHVRSGLEREQSIHRLNQLADAVNEGDEGARAEYDALREDIINWEENRPEIFKAPGVIG